MRVYHETQSNGCLSRGLYFEILLYYVDTLIMCAHKKVKFYKNGNTDHTNYLALTISMYVCLGCVVHAEDTKQDGILRRA